MIKNSSPNLLLLSKLAFAGGAVFWATTFITSLLPIAAEYRAAFSNWSMQTVWMASLPVGIIIGCGVSYFLMRFMHKNPTKNPIYQSVNLSLVSLVIATVLIDIPMGFHGQSNALYYSLIGVLFNGVRFLLLGLAIGYLYRRLYRTV